MVRSSRGYSLGQFAIAGLSDLEHPIRRTKASTSGGRFPLAVRTSLGWLFVRLLTNWPNNVACLLGQVIQIAVPFVFCIFRATVVQLLKYRRTGTAAASRSDQMLFTRPF
jgi:hypothetical protein